MKDFDFKTLVQDRNEAFRAVLDHDDMRKLRAYCRKYGIKMPTSDRTMKAAVFKAIPHCTTDFTDEDKSKAMLKAIELGFRPFLR